MPRAFITGIAGQDGMTLGQFLHERGYDVIGLLRTEGDPRRERIEAAMPGVRLIEGDVTDVPSLLRALGSAQPDEVYNLAAQSYVAGSWENSSRMADVNAKGVLNVLEAIRLTDLGIRFYQASSSEMFGKAQEVPQQERTAIWPRSPYGVAKAFGHYMTINYRESYGMHASSGILYNHESRRRPPEFVTRKITRAAARIAAGLQQELVLGDLDARRDWGWAGDSVRAMWLMLQQAEADDYVIATGQTHSVRDLLTIAFARVGIDDWGRFVRVDPELFRPTELIDIVGDPSKARAVLGWEPTVTFEWIVQDMVDADVELVRAETG